MDGKGNGSLAALIAVKLVCCGGLLLFATGAFTLGSLAAWLGNPWIQGGGATIVILVVAGVAVRIIHKQQPASGGPRNHHVPAASTSQR